MPINDSTNQLQYPRFSHAQREESIERLKSEAWDVLIIGGGINGAGVARDLALRSQADGLGLKIALIEKAHFAGGTSSKNSQLVHGGLRYLKYLNFSLVREALRERTTLMRIAPHLVRPQPFVLPFRGRVSSIYYSAGLFVYDRLAGENAIKPFQCLARGDMARAAPNLNQVRARSAAIFYDCVMEAARLVLANIQDAHARGAVAANYLKAQQFLWNGFGRVIGVAARDELSGNDFEIKARVVVNAAGPWGDLLRSTSSARDRILRLVRGSHLVFPKLFDDKLALAFFGNGGRIIFAIPWGANNELTLVGTTEVLHPENPGRVHISSEEGQYLTHAVSPWLPKIMHEEPVGSYSSLRPLIDGDSSSLSSASRDARIWIGADGVVNVAGGKYTTYRVMAGTAARLAGRELKIKFRERELTAIHPLGSLASVVHNEKERKRLAEEHGLDEKQMAYLARLYGNRLEEMLSIARASGGLKRIHPDLPALYGQISFAVQCEMAAHLSDFTAISTYLRYYRRWSREEIFQMAKFMGAQLGWDEKRVDEEAQSEHRHATDSSGAVIADH